MIEQQETIDIKILVGVLRRQYRLIVMCVMFFLAVAGAYLFQATPMYRSTALIMVDPSRKNLLESADPQMLNSSSESARIESEVAIVKSDRVLLSAIEKARLMSDPEFGPKMGLTDKIRLALGLEVATERDPISQTYATLKRLREAVTVQRSGLTYLINIGVASESGDKSAQIANALAATYIDLQLAAKRESTMGASEVLQDQLETARAVLADSEQRLDRFISANIDQIGEETGNAELVSLNSRLRQIENDRLSLEVRKQEADVALVSRDWENLAQRLGNEALLALEAERRQVEARLAGAPAGSADEMDLRGQLEKLDEQLIDLGSNAVNSLRDEVSQLSSSSNQLRQDLRQSVLGSALAPQTLTTIYEFQQEADIAQRQYSTLLSRMRDLETQAALQVADSRIVSEALPARTPFAPNTKLVLALALLLGLGGGVGLALLNEYYVGGIVSAHQLATVIPAPVVAAVPRFNQQPDQLSVADNVVEKPFSAYAEAFRKLRAGIDRLIDPDKKTKVILVCSAVPGEGKTSVALSLARTYALAGKRTLVVDGDLRKPSLHGHIGNEPQQGFLEYLLSDEHFMHSEGFYTLDTKTNAAVIVGRGRPTVPTDQVIQSRAFEELISRAREVLDVVVIDTSPVVPVVDARYMAPYADAIVQVVRYALSTQSDTRETYEHLREAAGPETPIVSVLNIDETGVQRYRYRDYYNDYTS